MHNWLRGDGLPCPGQAENFVQEIRLFS